MARIRLFKPAGRRLHLAVGMLTAWGLLNIAPAWGEERKFVVMLANSPKQFPNEDPVGQPYGGLANRDEIEDAYFDRTKLDVDSFAEYWDEISYGDVQVTGLATGWINLPWAIQPPLVDPEQDPPGEEGPPDSAARLSPAVFIDLDGNGSYQYGVGEPFDQEYAAVIIDCNGDEAGG